MRLLFEYKNSPSRVDRAFPLTSSNDTVFYASANATGSLVMKRLLAVSTVFDDIATIPLSSKVHLLALSPESVLISTLSGTSPPQLLWTPAGLQTLPSSAKLSEPLLQYPVRVANGRAAWATVGPRTSTYLQILSTASTRILLIHNEQLFTDVVHMPTTLSRRPRIRSLESPQQMLSSPSLPQVWRLVHFMSLILCL